jgi:hypothetical protein
MNPSILLKIHVSDSINELTSTRIFKAMHLGNTLFLVRREIGYKITYHFGLQ